MMAFEQRDNSASAFPNDKKGKENAPDFKGKSLVNGREYEISIWKKKDKNGNTWLSCSFGEPFKKAVKVAGDDDTPRRRPANEDSDFPEIPF
jgi:uncharacterized protein (DUF736 family)